jgi:hypothetical protein
MFFNIKSNINFIIFSLKIVHWYSYVMSIKSTTIINNNKNSISRSSKITIWNTKSSTLKRPLCIVIGNSNINYVYITINNINNINIFYIYIFIYIINIIYIISFIYFYLLYFSFYIFLYIIYILYIIYYIFYFI